MKVRILLFLVLAFVVLCPVSAYAQPLTAVVCFSPGLGATSECEVIPVDGAPYVINHPNGAMLEVILTDIGSLIQCPTGGCGPAPCNTGVARRWRIDTDPQGVPAGASYFVSLRVPGNICHCAPVLGPLTAMNIIQGCGVTLWHAESVGLPPPINQPANAVNMHYFIDFLIPQGWPPPPPPPVTSDLGDAPVGAGIAAHMFASSERLGTMVTAEAATVMPSWFGDIGDDGIVSVSSLFPGSAAATIVVSAMNPFGTFTDFCRLWVRRTAVTDGWSTVTDGLPTQSAAVGPAGTFFTFGPFTHSSAGAPSPYVRVRLSFDAAGISSSVGTGLFGEVEDYVLTGSGGPNTSGLLGSGVDAGDAPLPYPPVAHRFILSERLGILVDGDAMSPVGFPMMAWNNDGADDGIVRIDGLTPGGAATVQVFGSNPFGTFTDIVSCWMDFDGDGNWDEPGEIFAPATLSVPPLGATFTLGPIAVPAGSANPVPTRVKLHRNVTDQLAHLASGASANYGETEDYLFPLQWGTACNTTPGATPTIWAEDPPRIGLPFTWREAGLVPGVAVGAVLDVGLIPVPGGLDVFLFGIPVPPATCFLYPGLAFGTIPMGVADPAGNVTGVIPVPFIPTLAGATVYLQSFQVVLGPGFSLLMTPYLALTIL